MHLCIYIYASMYTDRSNHMCVYIYIFTHIYIIYIYIYVCVCANIYISTVVPLLLPRPVRLAFSGMLKMKGIVQLEGFADEFNHHHLSTEGKQASAPIFLTSFTPLAHQCIDICINGKAYLKTRTPQKKKRLRCTHRRWKLVYSLTHPSPPPA